MPMWFRSSNSRAWVGLATAMMAFGSSGCGTDDFVPPPPQELRGAAVGRFPVPASGSSKANSEVLGSATAGVRNIELILNGDVDPDELALQEGAARTQAGYDRARLRINIPDGKAVGAGESAAAPRSQVELVRDAIARHPQALIVEPAKPADPDLIKAIQEARAAKVPVILVGRPLADKSGTQETSSGPAPILVAPPPFIGSARELVAAAIRNAKNAKLDIGGGAIFLINTGGDVFIPDRVAAIREALKAAGVNAIQEVRFSKDTQVAQKLLTERLKADPKPVLVFSFDFLGATGSNSTANEIARERPFIQAGYASEDNLVRMAAAGEFAAVAHYIPARLIRKAVSLAVAAALKQEVPKPAEIPIPVHESPPNSGAPQMQAPSKSKPASP